MNVLKIFPDTWQARKNLMLDAKKLEGVSTLRYPSFSIIVGHIRYVYASPERIKPTKPRNKKPFDKVIIYDEASMPDNIIERLNKRFKKMERR